MLSALFEFLAAVKNRVEEILAQFPQTSAALASIAAALASYFGWHVDGAQLTAIFVAAVTLFHLLVHQSINAVALRAAKAEKAAARR